VRWKVSSPPVAANQGLAAWAQDQRLWCSRPLLRPQCILAQQLVLHSGARVCVRLACWCWLWEAVVVGGLQLAFPQRNFTFEGGKRGVLYAWPWSSAAARRCSSLRARFAAPCARREESVEWGVGLGRARRTVWVCPCCWVFPCWQNLNGLCVSHRLPNARTPTRHPHPQLSRPAQSCSFLAAPCVHALRDVSTVVCPLGCRLVCLLEDPHGTCPPVRQWPCALALCCCPPGARTQCGHRLTCCVCWDVVCCAILVQGHATRHASRRTPTVCRAPVAFEWLHCLPRCGHRAHSQA
jgi:hypothetical protein